MKYAFIPYSSLTEIYKFLVDIDSTNILARIQVNHNGQYIIYTAVITELNDEDLIVFYLKFSEYKNEFLLTTEYTIVE